MEPLIREEGESLQVLEIEPQTLWLRTRGESGFRVDQGRFDYVRALPGVKLLHSVGYPVGGYHRAEADQLHMLNQMIAAFNPPWMSEHLAFNRATASHGVFQTGFLLPPLQTEKGVRAAASSVQCLAKQVGVPLAVEHGVSYLKLRDGELPDGAFLRSVAEAADCGIVLDLHNAWTNASNGRQAVEHFFKDIPLERVWEVHLAGGMEYEGYWLDAHSGEIPKPVLDLAREAIPRLPNLKALIFEVMPVYLESIGLATIRAQLDELRRLWELRDKTGEPTDLQVQTLRRLSVARRGRADGITPEIWENTLGALAIGREVDTPLARQLSSDLGVSVFRYLVAEFRASSVIGTLPFTGRLLLLSMGAESFEAMLGDYWRDHPPEAFGAEEARQFATFLQTRAGKIPHLEEVMRFDLAAIAAITEGTPETVCFSQDPRHVLGALADHRLPTGSPAGLYYADLRSDGITFRSEPKARQRTGFDRFPL
jgi:uncharacterized protein (UPF0276 family)